MVLVWCGSKQVVRCCVTCERVLGEGTATRLRLREGNQDMQSVLVVARPCTAYRVVRILGAGSWGCACGAGVDERVVLERHVWETWLRGFRDRNAVGFFERVVAHGAPDEVVGFFVVFLGWRAQRRPQRR